jgi:hypothetical protein
VFELIKRMVKHFGSFFRTVSTAAGRAVATAADHNRAVCGAIAAAAN